MSKSIYDVFETDAGKETDGIVLDYGEMGSIMISRAGGANKKFAKSLEFRSRPYKRQIDKGTMDNDTAVKLMAEVFADTIVIGWVGINDREGNPIEFNKENCVKLFIDLPELFADVQDASTSIANFQQEQNEDDSKN